MRGDEEVRQAIAILGASFVGPGMRAYVWGNFEHEAAKAWAMFQTLGWVAGAEESDFCLTLTYAQLKMQQFIDQQQEKKHAR